MKNYFSVQICSFWALLSEKCTIFDPFWPLGCHKKSKNLQFALNEWKYKICDEKLYLCVNLQLLGIIFRGMDSFWPFCLPPPPHWPLGCPKTSQKMSLDKNNFQNQIPRAKFCIFKQFQFLRIILLEMGNFDSSPILLPPSWPLGTRKWRSHGKSLWV